PAGFSPSIFAHTSAPPPSGRPMRTSGVPPMTCSTLSARQRPPSSATSAGPAGAVCSLTRDIVNEPPPALVDKSAARSVQPCGQTAVNPYYVQTNLSPSPSQYPAKPELSPYYSRAKPEMH